MEFDDKDPLDQFIKSNRKEVPQSKAEDKSLEFTVRTVAELEPIKPIPPLRKSASLPNRHKLNLLLAQHRLKTVARGVRYFNILTDYLEYIKPGEETLVYTKAVFTYSTKKRKGTYANLVEHLSKFYKNGDHLIEDKDVIKITLFYSGLKSIEDIMLNYKNIKKVI